MDISVVVPTYNRADLLPLTLEAILAQTEAPCEILVVDDGSTDDTQDVLARFAPRVQAIRIANSGSIVARNVGLRAARGELVAFCDSDDLWRPAFLSRMRAVWQAEPRTQAAYSDFVLVRNGTWEAASKFSGTPAGFWDGLRDVGPGIGLFDSPITRRLLDFQPFFPSCFVARRSALLAAGGWDEGVGRVVGDDFGTALRVAELCPFGVVTEPLVGIRKHDGNYSRDTRAMALGDSLILEYALATRPSLAGMADTIRENVAHRRRIALHLAFDDCDFAAVGAIYPLIPEGGRPFSIQVKRRVAGLPAPIRSAIARFLLLLGTARSRGLRASRLPDAAQPRLSPSAASSAR
jgi:hypothetical protein